MGGRTAQVKEVVVLQAVDGLELAADVVLLCCVEQVPDGRVLVISTKDLLGLEGPVAELVSLCSCPTLPLRVITQPLGKAWGLTCLACRRPRP